MDLLTSHQAIGQLVRKDAGMPGLDKNESEAFHACCFAKVNEKLPV